MVTVAKTKINVMPASRMLSAISLGVFCRTAPSTSAIWGSRRVELGAAVIRTLSQSEVTRVPPVTAERSPPLSRMTGADSPVIADSSTEATPSITSPSEGMRSPASTRTISPFLSAAAAIVSKTRVCAFGMRLAFVSVRMRRSVSACALPRPSAIASAKLANSTVNQSHTVICPEKRGLLPPHRPCPHNQIADEEDRRQDRDNLDHEHDRVGGKRARVELPEGSADRRH